MAQYQADYEEILEPSQSNRTLESVTEGEGRFIDWKLINQENSRSILTGEEAVFEFTFLHRRPTEILNIRFMITDLHDKVILAGENIAEIREGTNLLRWFCSLPLKVDQYKIIAEAYINQDASLVDRWNSQNQLEITPFDEVLPYIQGVINIPTGFEVVQK